MTREFDFWNRAAVARRRFIRTQSAKAGLGVGLCGICMMLARPRGVVAVLAFCGLMAPVALGLLARLGVALAPLERASLLLLAALLCLLSAFSGGLASPFLVWFVILPFEASLTGRRNGVAFAAVSAVAALLVVAGLQFSAHLPASLLPGASAQWTGASLLIAILQASLMAIAAKRQNRAAGAAAEAGEMLHHFLAENTQDLITRHARDGRILYAGPASLVLLGFRPDELFERPLAGLVHAEDRGDAVSVFEQALRGRAASSELRLLTKGGNCVWGEIRCQPVSPMGAGGDVVAIMRDITARKAHERALIGSRNDAVEANRAKSRFLANMSHELRTPLNAIIGFSQVMVHELFGPVGTPRYREYVRLIHESGSHLLRLINSVLDMSKIEAGRFQLTAEEFDVEEAIDQALHFVTLQAERKGVRIHSSASSERRHALADKSAALQILINLLSNAVKFTPEGGSIAVTGAVSPAGLELVVADLGVGISAADLERLGQPFEQVRNTYTRNTQGTGLGLALVHALASLHGGTVTIKSSPGEGTTVRVLLPLLPETGQSIPRVA